MADLTVSYSKSRVPQKRQGKAKMSQHFQFEANMTLSGASADIRVPATPSQQKNILAHLYAQPYWDKQSLTHWKQEFNQNLTKQFKP